MLSESSNRSRHHPHPFFSSFYSDFPASPEDIPTDSNSSAHHLESLATESSNSLKNGPNFNSTTHTRACTDTEQMLSERLIARDVATRDPFGGLFSPNTTSSSYSRVDEISASPAAMFLSSFSVPSTPSHPPDSEGQSIGGYILGPIIGHGGFSTIRTANSPSGGVVAVKIVRHSDLSRQDNPTLARRRLNHEAAVWASLSHEHILPLFSTEHSSYADFFITLYCPAGSLFDILKRDGRPALPQDDAGMMFRQVVRGLSYMHQVAGVVHRDIKLENVLVDEMGVCRIGDFGMTTKIGEMDVEETELSVEDEPSALSARGGGLRNPPVSKRHPKPGGLHVHLSLIRHHGGRHRNVSAPAQANLPAPPSAHVFQPGSLPYAAPELLQPQVTPLHPHPAQDIWALGVVLYALLTGRLPFVDSFEPRLQMKILHGVYDVPTDIGRGAERVLQGCLEKSPDERWTIAQVDDVAWGVGWGTECDDVSSEEEDDEVEEIPVSSSTSSVVGTPRATAAGGQSRASSRAQSRAPSRPHSISRPHSPSPPSAHHYDAHHAQDIPPPPTNIDPDLEIAPPTWKRGESATRPSLAAAKRRSSSRAQRSLSRAPALTDRCSSSRGVNAGAVGCGIVGCGGGGARAAQCGSVGFAERGGGAGVSMSPSISTLSNNSSSSASSSSSSGLPSPTSWRGFEIPGRRAGSTSGSTSGSREPLERGRRRNKLSSSSGSRTPSPGGMPPSPFGHPLEEFELHPHPHTHAHSPNAEGERDISRGRRRHHLAGSGGRGTRTPRAGDLFEGLGELELGVVDEGGSSSLRWAMEDLEAEAGAEVDLELGVVGGGVEGEKGRGRDARVDEEEEEYEDEEEEVGGIGVDGEVERERERVARSVERVLGKGRRPGSAPPAPISGAPDVTDGDLDTVSSLSLRFSETPLSGRQGLLIGKSIKGSTRSRSVGV